MKRIPAVSTTFDVAFWFLTRGERERVHIPPQKLHRLLYLSQAYYAYNNDGRKLMPAVFVAEEMGPVEPTIWRLFESGLPTCRTADINPMVVAFLDKIWTKYGHRTAEQLNRTVEHHGDFREARTYGLGSEITVEAMVKGVKDGKDASKMALRTVNGKPVQKWVPARRISRADLEKAKGGGGGGPQRVPFG